MDSNVVIFPKSITHTIKVEMEGGPDGSCIICRFNDGVVKVVEGYISGERAAESVAYVSKVNTIFNLAPGVKLVIDQQAIDSSAMGL